MPAKPMHVDGVAETVKGLGRQLREARVKQGLTQAEMASLIGVSIPSYQALEAGRGTTALWTWVAACLLLGVDLQH